MSETHARRGQGILQATLEQLAVVGFRALSIEDVASRAGVNKTTVYRRWPTKVGLVRAAMDSFSEGSLVQPDTGSLRGDLLSIGRTFQARASSLEGQSLFRAIALESTEPEFLDIATMFRVAHEAVIAGLLAAARARGEIDHLPDHRLIAALVIGPLHLRMFVGHERVDEAYMARLVDTILVGLSPRKVATRRRALRRRTTPQ